MVDEFQVGTAPQLCVALSAPRSIELLRVCHPERGILDMLSAALGNRLPESGMSIGEAPRLSWRAPGEWMIVDGGAMAVVQPLLEGRAGHIVDVTDGFARFAVDGARSRDLLAKACSLDLHPRSFDADRCGRTLFAQTHLMIDRVGGGNLFHLYVDVSVTNYLRRWFEDAILEFRL